MTKSAVAFKGLSDNTEAGRQLFLVKFAAGFQMSPSEAESWLRRSQGLLFHCESEAEAEQRKGLLESIGALAEIKAEADSPAKNPEAAGGYVKSYSRSSPAAPPSPAPPAPPAAPAAAGFGLGVGAAGAERAGSPGGPSFPGPYPGIGPGLGVSQDDKTLALIAHLGTLAGFIFPFGNVIAPLVVWLVKKDQSRFVAVHALESLNFQISITIYAVVTVALCFIFIGLLVLPALIIFQLIVIILAAIKASNGEYYRYPLCIRVIS